MAIAAASASATSGRPGRRWRRARRSPSRAGSRRAGRPRGRGRRPRRPGRAGDDDGPASGERAARAARRVGDARHPGSTVMRLLPVAAAAAGLRGDPHVGDAGVLVDGLDHVDEREGGDGDRGERLHLDAGAVGGAHDGPDVDPVVDDVEVDLDGVHRHRVGERDELGGALDRLDAGDPRHAERVALGHDAVAQGRDGRRREQHPAGRGRPAGRHRLAGDVDHVRRAVGAHVGQPAAAAGSVATVAILPEEGEAAHAGPRPRPARRRRAPGPGRSPRPGRRGRASPARPRGAPGRRPPRPGSAPPCRARPATPASATASNAPSSSGSSPASRRRAGSTNTWKDDERADRVAREGDHRGAASADDTAALRHPRPHRDLDELDATVRR